MFASSWHKRHISVVHLPGSSIASTHGYRHTAPRMSCASTPPPGFLLSSRLVTTRMTCFTSLSMFEPKLNSLHLPLESLWGGRSQVKLVFPIVFQSPSEDRCLVGPPFTPPEVRPLGPLTSPNPRYLEESGRLGSSFGGSQTRNPRINIVQYENCAKPPDHFEAQVWMFGRGPWWMFGRITLRCSDPYQQQAVTDTSKNMIALFSPKLMRKAHIFSNIFGQI